MTTTLVLLTALLAAAPTPEITAPVTDLVDAVPADAQAEIDAQILAIRDETKAQIAVLVVDTTHGVPIEDYSLQVAQAWGGGRKGFDDGVLITLALKDRRMRIEVGYGLEGALTDAEAAAIIDASKPALRDANYGAAIAGMVNAVAAQIRGEEIVPLFGHRSAVLGQRLPWAVLVVLLLGWATGFALVLRSPSAREKKRDKKVARRRKLELWGALVAAPIVVATTFYAAGFWWTYLMAWFGALIVGLWPGVAWKRSRIGASLLALLQIGVIVIAALLGTDPEVNPQPWGPPTVAGVALGAAAGGSFGIGFFTFGASLFLGMIVVLLACVEMLVRFVVRADHKFSDTWMAALGGVLSEHILVGWFGESSGGGGSSYSSSSYSSSSYSSSSYSSSSSSYSGGGGSFGGGGASGSW